MVATPPPSKKEQLLKLLERGSVFVHLDPRREGVSVPAWLAKKPQLVLQLGLNFPIPIRDLEIDQDGVRCTLSFNRSPYYCVLPWHAVYALVAEDGDVTVWPSDLPSELVPTTEPAVRRAAPRTRGTRGDHRPRISVVPPPADDATAPTTDATPKSAEPSAAERASESHSDSSAQVDTESARPRAEPASNTPPSTRPARERPPYLRLVK